MTFPFHIGTTSYIIPDDILPNVRYLSGKVEDIELVLFEIDDGPNNLPDPVTISTLQQLAVQHHLSYTVHLPLDLRLADEEGKQHISLIKARHVIESTRALQPWAYVLHLDGRELLENHDQNKKKEWNRQAALALEQVSAWVDDPAQLAVENLDHYPLDFWDEVLENSPVSRCIDIGHLWYDGHDPIPYLHQHLARTRVIHLHGFSDRDHQSLSQIPGKLIRKLLDYLILSGYGGVVTLEVFNEKDLFSSLEAIHKFGSE